MVRTQNTYVVYNSFARNDASFFHAGYDGGDCCECTCVLPENSWNDDNACSDNSGFACIDPEAKCVNDDDITVDVVENCEDVSGPGQRSRQRLFL